MTINRIQDEIIEEFSEVDDWMDRYAMIIDLGNSLPAIDSRFKTPEHLIEGCQSRVWLNAEEKDGKVYYRRFRCYHSEGHHSPAYKSAQWPYPS